MSTTQKSSSVRSWKHGLALGALYVLVPGILWADVALPHVLAPNTPAKAGDLNENFKAITDAMGKTTTFVHVSNANNTRTNPVTNFTTIDNPATNNQPSATLFVTRVLAGNFSVDPIPVSLGVFYDASTSRWNIQRQDTGQLPLNAGFNVMVVLP